MQYNGVQRGLKIMHWNCQGTTTIPQAVELHKFLNEKSIDILLLNETFLKPNHRFQIPGYKVHRKDRISHGGGVAIVIKSTLKHNVESSFPTKLIENLCVSVDLLQHKVTFISAYCPRYTPDFIRDLEMLTSATGDFFILGDLNAHHLNYNCSKSDTAGNLLFNHQNNSNYYIYYPPNPTRYPQNLTYRQPSTIDLLLTNSSLNFTDLETCPNNLYSDHVPIIFSIVEDITHTEKYYLDFRNANWISFRTSLNSRISSCQFNYENISSLNIEESIKEFTEFIKASCLVSIPLKSQKIHNHNLNHLCKYLITTRNKYRRKLQRCTDLNSKITLSAIIKELNKLIAQNINNEKNAQWSKFLSTIPVGNRKFWKITKKIRGGNKPMKNLVVDNTEIFCNKKKANIIADQFERAHLLTARFPSSMENKANYIFNTLDGDTSSNSDAPSLTSLDEIKFFISCLKNSKAPGIDQINNILLKNLPLSALNYLLRIYNFCISNSYFPNAFKLAKVIPIPKSGKDERLPSNYRPISLLSSLGKLLEKIVYHRLHYFVEENNLIHRHQFGFRSGHSTIHQIKRVVNIIKSNRNRRYSTGILFLDIEKAFDSIWHQGLIFKLHKMNIPTYLTKLIKNFLNDRKFVVDVDGSQSTLRNIPAGVPQGSILSPLLYSLYISDFKITQGNDVAFYADDSAIICHGKVSNSIVGKIQNALVSAVKYFSKWKIQINREKSQAILFPYNKSPKRIPSKKLIIQGTEIEFAKTIKYLGITLDQKLNFKEHIASACLKANRCGRSLYPILNRKSKLNFKNKLLLFKMCIRPILTYGCQIWYGCAKTHLKKLQIIQNKNLKIIYNLPSRYPTDVLHSRANIKSIKNFITDMALSFEEKCRRSIYAHLRSLI